jgi:hypothetical protein
MECVSESTLVYLMLVSFIGGGWIVFLMTLKGY